MRCDFVAGSLYQMLFYIVIDVRRQVTWSILPGLGVQRNVATSVAVFGTGTNNWGYVTVIEADRSPAKGDLSGNDHRDGTLNDTRRAKPRF